MSFFVRYRQDLAEALSLPDTASWEDCLETVKALAQEAKVSTCEDHDWMERGTTDDRWWQCFLCGHIED